MRTVWKFPVRLGDNVIEGPGLDSILHVDVQGGRPVAWATVETDRPLNTATLVISGTGHTAPAGRYVNSFFEGPFVWHAWQVA